MRTVHVYQVDPAQQESNLFYIDRSGNLVWEDEYWENISIIPRPRYHFRMSETVKEVFDNLESGNYADDPEELTGRLAPVAQLIKDYSWDYCRNTSTLCTVLGIITGTPYTSKEIRGCCQDDWQVIVYPENEYNADDIRAFETLFFNTGTQWSFSENTPEADEEYSIYCTRGDVDSIRSELADYIGTVPENVIMHKFEGYTRIPKYRIV